MGQLLWSGIVDDSKADAVVDHIMGDHCSADGARTLATGEAAFNPLSYHDGTVAASRHWLIAAGLARYRRREEPVGSPLPCSRQPATSIIGSRGLRRQTPLTN